MLASSMQLLLQLASENAGSACVRNTPCSTGCPDMVVLCWVLGCKPCLTLSRRLRFACLQEEWT
jgi:hypothetical protein